MSRNPYDVGVDLSATGNIICEKCQVPLEIGSVSLSYLGNSYTVHLPKCPKCGLVFIPEELALGRMLQVEKALEDK